MIPFEPQATHVLWFNRWRECVREAKTNPVEREGYCRAAVIAQAYYEMHVAIYKVIA